MSISEKLEKIISELGINTSVNDGLEIFTPLDSSLIAKIEEDSKTSLNSKASNAKSAQKKWHLLSIKEKEKHLNEFADLIEENEELLAQIINLESGKVITEARGEAKNLSATLRKTIDIVQNKKYEDLNKAERKKKYIPVGVVGVITSFNFPLAVAGWSIAPALLAGNSVLWKPSEKTPLVALAVKAIFDQTKMPESLFDIVIGGVYVGKKFVENELIGMISATGSVAMGASIKATLAKKESNLAQPILELGGNNGVIISNSNDDEAIEHAVDSISKSFLGSSGQRCTNTRRVFVHEEVAGKVIELFSNKVSEFEIDSPLIDQSAVEIYDNSIKAVKDQGGEVLFGGQQDGEGFYIKPALAVMPKQTEIMHEECFAPLLYIVKYSDYSDAVRMVNEPDNAGLVNGIYSQNKDEIDQFVEANMAGHTVINTSTGTGTPAHGLGFGGNKDSGVGEILNQHDPLKPFSRAVSRVVRNREIPIE